MDNFARGATGLIAALLVRILILSHAGSFCLVSNRNILTSVTDGDCVNVAENLPVCANSTWDMYALSKTTFFCCEPGQIGIIPIRGYTGICGYPEQVVASSLIATRASQIGGAAVTTVVGNTGGGAAPTSTKIITSSLKGGGVTTITSLVGQTVAAGTDASQPTTTGSSATGAGAPGTTKKSSFGLGAIIGIAVGGLLLLVIALLVFLLVKSKNKNRKFAQGDNQSYQYNGGNQGGAPMPMYNSTPAPYQSPVQEQKTPVVGYAQPAPPAGQGKHGGGYMRSQDSQSQGQQGSHRPPTPELQGKHGGGYLRYQEGQGQGQQGIHEISSPKSRPVEYDSPLVEAPSRWERRVEIGGGK